MLKFLGVVSTKSIMYGERLKRVIKESGYDRLDIANKVGISSQGLHKLLNSPYPNLKRLEDICNYIGISLSEFFGDPVGNKIVALIRKIK